MVKTMWWLAGAAAVLAGCGASTASSSDAGHDGAGGQRADPDVGAASDDAPVFPRQPECGDTVDATGSLFGTPFVARYIYMLYVAGDCPETVEVMIAESSSSDSASLTIYLTRDPATHSFVGHSTPRTLAFPGGGGLTEDVSAAVDVTMFPDAIGTQNPDAASLSANATFTISGASVSITGSFSGPICSLAICV